MTGITGAADAKAAGPYTMLTIASVVMGGGYLMGGLVTVPEPYLAQ
jgi:ribose transport system ATP-binding protein